MLYNNIKIFESEVFIMSKKLNNENQHNQIILNNSNSYTCQYGYLHKYKKMLDNTVQENTLFQYWKWENGKIYHVDKLTGRKKERLYIHFSNR